MDLSALIVVIAGTLLFFGFAVWMGFFLVETTMRANEVKPIN